MSTKPFGIVTWATPHDWLEDKVGQCDSLIDLRKRVMSLAAQLEADTLQELFEGEMAADGYFADEDGEEAW